MYCCDIFSTGKLRKNKPLVWTIWNLFPFSTAQTEKNSWNKLVKQIDENKWWADYTFSYRSKPIWAESIAFGPCLNLFLTRENHFNSTILKNFQICSVIYYRIFLKGIFHLCRLLKNKWPGFQGFFVVVVVVESISSASNMRLLSKNLISGQ